MILAFVEKSHQDECLCTLNAIEVILFNNSSLNINEEGNIDVSGTIIGDISSNAVSISEYNALYKEVIMQENMIG